MLTLSAAQRAAAVRLRRAVPVEELAGWTREGHLTACVSDAGEALVPAAELKRHLDRIAPQERLLTVSETVDRLAERWAIAVTRRTVTNWIDHGAVASDGSKVRLPCTYSPQFSPNHRLIKPRDLDTFVERVGPNLGKRGRPLKVGRE